ncbi:hypothetical protein HPB50_013871 [Hyalomma asiaticum]|uniref:Uncharacterized protein n=1 Tax=Hyalomma asiaticum TaxID=266040 RepID=A0ACB7T561_HYAAI|nr:hypothetical protein HPB50_013871 [Hyalomma asiaticum]
MIEARREITGMQRRALIAERPLVGEFLGGGTAAVAIGPAVQDVPGSGAVTGAMAAVGLGATRGPTYAAVLCSEAQTGAPGSGQAGPKGVVGGHGSSTGVTHEHVTFLKPTGRTDALVWDVMRLLKRNIDPVAEDNLDVTLRNTRNFISSRVFELVNLCSDLRAHAATQRGAAMALQGQLVEARREIVGLQRRAMAAEQPLVVGGGAAAVKVGPAVQGVPGSGAVAGSTTAVDLGTARGLTYAAVLSSGVPAGPLVPRTATRSDIVQ